MLFRSEGGELGPGEIRLAGGSCAVKLGRRLELDGELYLNGRALYEVVRDIVIDVLS